INIQGGAAGAKVELRAMDGRLLASLRPTTGNSYPLPELAAGVYIVRALNEDGKLQTGRFVVR
ncbi:MAG: T9SS type A sorting domain-containing protein, partial [Lewinella sp.]